CHLEAVVMTDPCSITLVLVGTLGACIPTVGTGCDMVVLAGATAITGVGIVTRTGGSAATGRACHLEAVVMTDPCSITLVLVGTLAACIPTVGTGCDMVVLAGATAIAGVGIVTLARPSPPTAHPCHLEAVVMTDPCSITLVLVGTLGACI